MKKLLSLLLSAILIFTYIPCVNAAYTAEDNVYTWDLTDITDDINYVESDFKSGTAYEYNGLTIQGKNSASVINENGVKIGKASSKWGYISYTPSYDGKLTVTATIGKSGNYYSKIIVSSTSSITYDTSEVVITGTATGSFSGEIYLEANTTYTLSEIPTTSKMTLNNTFADNMLIQRDKPIILKGTCENVQGATITLQNDNDESDLQTTTIELNDLTQWKTTLNAVSNYTDTYTLTITPQSDYDGAEKIVISNIIFGDLYLCGGQSNMVVTASVYKDMGIDYTAEQLATQYDNIRFLDLSTKHTYSSEEKEDIVASASWNILKSGGVPATAYSFAEKLYNETNIPVGIIVSSVQGSYISQWLPNTGIDSNNKTKNLYNTEIYPFRDMQLSGILWYQGESDSRAIDTYKDKLKNLISLYRGLFANTDDVPFYFVSIVRCGAYEEDNTMFDYMSEVRAIQAEVYSELKGELDNFGIIPTLDLYGNKENDPSYSGTWGISRGNARSSIHSGQKPIIAERAVNWVLSDIYEYENINTLGPVYKSKTVSDDKLIVEFECSGNLKLMDIEQYSDNDAEKKRTEYGIDPSKPQEFEIAGEDGVYYRADAELDGNKVILNSTKVSSPVNFRYGYTGRNGDAYIECPNLTDDTCLPALVVSTAYGTTGDDTVEPSATPTATPSAEPTATPTATPSAEPTAAPTTAPTDVPSESPTPSPSKEPADEPQIKNGRIVYSADFSDSDTSKWTDSKSTLSIKRGRN